VQYLKVFKYLVQYLIFKYYLNTAKSEVFHKVFKYSGQSICPNTDSAHSDDVDWLFNEYTSYLSDLLDKRAPQQVVCCKPRRSDRWFDEDCRVAK